LNKRIHNVFNVYQLKKYRSETTLLDAFEQCSNSLVELQYLPLDEHDHLLEPIAEAETTDVSPGISHRATQPHSDV